MIKNIFILLFFWLFTVFTSSAFATNAMYVLASKQMSLTKNHNRIADIVANTETTGYKSEKDVNVEIKKRTDINQKVSFSGVGITVRDYSQGSLIATGRQLDVAINGDGYFMVQTPRGVRFTRAGNFKVNTEGALSTKEGYPLVGPGGGQIEFSEGDIDINIRDNGLVNAGSEERGQLGVFTFKDDQLLVREGKALYRTSQNPQPAEDAVVVQGMLEGSNVNSIQAMTRLIEVSRGIERVKKIQKDMHEAQTRTLRTLKDR